jgi:hypothetical protein
MGYGFGDHAKDAEGAEMEEILLIKFIFLER